MIQCRSLSGYVTEVGLGTNPFIWYGIALLLLLELAFVCLPFVHVAFSTSKQRTRQGDQVLFLQRQNAGYEDGYWSVPAGVMHRRTAHDEV
jgi:hypothetical protein